MLLSGNRMCRVRQTAMGCNVTLHFVLAANVHFSQTVS